MTISSTTRKAGPFVGNDSSTAFPFAFKVFQAADVYVVRLDTDTSVETPLVLTTDYTVSLNANQNANPGGTVTLVAGALATGYTLTITSSITPLQSTDLTNQGGFYPSVITNALDKLTILVQQILERLGRSLTLPLSLPSNVSTALPLPEANKALVWNSTATGLENYDASQIATSILGASRVIDRFTATGSAGPYALSSDPLTINNTMVFVGGVYQTHDKYTLAGATITFDEAVANGTVVELVQQLAVTYPVSALSPNVVGTGNIIDEAVTNDKVASGSLTLSRLATAVQNLINGALQKSGGTMTGKIVLDGDATLALHPTTKQQVDAQVVGKNRVINGTFSLNQRAFAGGARSAGVYGHDRWKAGAGGATYTVAGETATITVGTLQQVIEGLNVPEGGTYTLSWSGTAQARVDGGSYAASPITVTGKTAGSNITIEFGTGTVTKVQFEAGASATNFERRLHSSELAAAQRYYLAMTSRTIRVSGVAGGVGQYADQTITLPVEMRAAPTVGYSINTNVNVSTGAPGTSTKWGCQLTITASTTGQFSLNFTDLNFDAEI